MPAVSTPNYGLQKPDPNDIIDVVIAVNTNMDILDANINQGVVLASCPPDTALLTSYVIGMSMFRVTATDIATYPGWAVEAGAQSAVVVTFKPATDRMVQMWYRGTTASHAAYYRYCTTTGNNAWVKIGGPDNISVYSTSNVGVLSSWQKAALSTVDFVAGVDCVASGGGVLVRTGGTYQLEGYVQWDGAASSAGTKYLGIDDTTLAGPSTWNRDTKYADNNQSVTHSFSMRRSFPNNTTLALWLNVSNATGCNTSLRRLTVSRVNA